MMPPEVISGMIYAGPGNGSLLKSAQAWIALAEDLDHQMLDTQAVLSGLSDAWLGPSQQAMASAMAPFVSWLASISSSARQSALATLNAASAYEEVLAAVVPPPVIASNRAQLLMLVGTNLLGQNTATIAANEAHYESMWAQDIAAMNTYQTNSQAAVAQLPSLQPAPAVANASVIPAAAAPAQGTIVDTINALLEAIGLGSDSNIAPLVYSFIQGFGEAPIAVVQLFSSFFGPFLGSTLVASMIDRQNNIIASKPTVPSVVYPPTSSAASESPKVSASSGTGNRIGSLRVPPSWAQSPQASAATPLTPTGGNNSDKKGIPVGLPVIPAVPVMGNKSEWKKGVKFEDLDYGEPVAPVINRHPSGG